MLPEEEVEKYFKEHYEKKNHKRARSINVPERLYRDFHKLCIDKGKSMSKVITHFMTLDVMTDKSSGRKV